MSRASLHAYDIPLLALALGGCATRPAKSAPAAVATVNPPSPPLHPLDRRGPRRLGRAAERVTLLRRMARDPRQAALVDATLPVMGMDGTLSKRMRGTRAEGTVHAKTRSIAKVRALSGYLTTADGERLVFSIVANNFKAPATSVDGVADQAVERLVNFRR